LVLEEAAVRAATSSRIRLKFDIDLQFRPALPDQNQESNTQHQDDHSITPFRSIDLRTSARNRGPAVEFLVSTGGFTSAYPVAETSI
jgi:hypothetical protein